MDQHVDTVEQAIHDGRVTQVAMHDILVFHQGGQRLGASRRAQWNVTRDQRGPYYRAKLTAGPTQGNLLHRFPLRPRTPEPREQCGAVELGLSAVTFE